MASLPSFPYFKRSLQIQNATSLHRSNVVLDFDSLRKPPVMRFPLAFLYSIPGRNLIPFTIAA